MKQSVASCFVSGSSVDRKKCNGTDTIPTQRHDDVLAARELADARGPHLHIDLSLHHPCTVAVGAKKGRRWFTVRNRSHRHNTRVAQEGDTTTGSTWIGDGKRQQAGPLVGLRSPYTSTPGRSSHQCDVSLHVTEEYPVRSWIIKLLLSRLYMKADALCYGAGPYVSNFCWNSFIRIVGLFVCLLSIRAPYVPWQAMRPMKDRVVH
jgi:hypothetical protein